MCGDTDDHGQTRTYTDEEGMWKWVSKEDEKEIRTVFAASVAVRVKGKEAREVAEAVFVRDISACSSCGRRG